MNTDTLLTLDDSRAQDPAVVGAKAAGLALCRAQGLPVPDGFAVPVSWGQPAVQAGANVLEGRGSGGARLTVSSFALDPMAASQLLARAADVRPPLMVRSSAVVEASKRWSGAFSSFEGIQPAEVSTAVRACWSSVFTVDALKRLEAEHLEPHEIGMAILVQEEVRADFGGVASVDPGGVVSVTWIQGPPALIVSGREPGNTVHLDPGRDPSGVGCDLAQVAAVSRTVMERCGFNHVEWAQADGRVWVLQASTAHRVGPSTSVRAKTPVRDHRLTTLARLLSRCPGAALERWVLSWAIGLEDVVDPIAPGTVDLGSLVAAIDCAAAELVAQRWRSIAAEAMDEAHRTLTQLRSPEPLGALDKMTRLGDIDPVAAGELLGLIQRLGAELASEGRIPSVSVARHLSVELLDDLASGRMPKLPPSRRFGMGKWEPLLYDVVSATGVPVAAMAVVGGRGAGRLRMIRGLQDLDTFEPREILGSAYPMNNLSPLLWEASAVFTLRGGSGAHAFEVANALGVPAICNAEHDEFHSIPAETLVAVDGDAGVLWLLPADPGERAEAEG